MSAGGFSRKLKTKSFVPSLSRSATSAPVCWVDGPGSGNAPLVVLRCLHCGSAPRALRHASKANIASTAMKRRPNATKLLKIINHTPGAIGFEGFFDEFEMQRMHLIVVLRLLAWEDQIESDLVGLINDRSMAWDHPAHMTAKDT